MSLGGLANAPDPLTKGPRFVCWRHGPNDPILINPRTGDEASLDDPDTWATQEDASLCARYHDGMLDGYGPVHTLHDPYAWLVFHEGVVEYNYLWPPVKDLLNTIGTYAEYGPRYGEVQAMVTGHVPRIDTDHVTVHVEGFRPFTGKRFMGDFDNPLEWTDEHSTALQTYLDEVTE